VCVQSPSTQNAHTDDRRENDNAPAGSGLLIGEIGVGSGAIAVSLAKHLHGVRIIATDISHDALEVARTNAETHGVAARITFLCGDGATPLLEAADVRAHGGLDYLVSNPPYIPDAEWDDPAMMDAHVREHEPAIALRGGADGLDVIRPIVRAAPRLLKPEGVLVVETAASTAQTLADGVNRTPGVRTRTIRTDMDGKPRVVVAERDA
jgi:release factor glutamine methyltransferase